MRRLYVSIIGEVVPEAKEEDNPSAYLNDDRTQEIVMYVAGHYPRRGELYDRFPDAVLRIDNLFHVGALREEDRTVYLNFSLFTREDHRILYDVAARQGENLAGALLDREREIRELAGAYRRTGASAEKVAFIAIGFLFLDWASLNRLSECGYMYFRRPQTGGTFTVCAEESIELDLRTIYWGGHTDEYDGLVFLSFGDHVSPRRAAFPDILWRNPFRICDDYDSPEARGVLSTYMKPLKRDLACAVRSLAGKVAESSDAVGACKGWFERLGYARNGVLSVPYFDEGDLGWLRPLGNLVLGEVDTWCERYYTSVKKALSESTPLRHGVDYREVFAHFWHWVFGMTNSNLARRGLIYDTYEPGSTTPGYLPAAVESAIMEEMMSGTSGHNPTRSDG